MSTLLSLSNELLLQIIEETRPDSIRSFVRCCKTIWILGAEALEQHQQDLNRYEMPDFSYSYDAPERDLTPYEYLSEFLLKPRRALYVNRILFRNHGFTLEDARNTSFKKETLVMIDDICSTFFNGLGCPYIDSHEVSSWVERLRHGDTDAVVCLCLTLVPNLEVLSISDFCDQGCVDLIYKVSKASQLPHCVIPGPLPLHKLNTIIINDIPIRPKKGIGIYETCMTLPSLRRLKGKFITYNFNHWPLEEEFSLKSNVETVIFHDSAINNTGFAKLLSRITTLQRLTYGFAPIPGIVGDHTAMGLKKVLEQYTKDTLTHLELKFEEIHPQSQKRFIGSLRWMKSLRHLRLQASMFIDYSVGHKDPKRPVDLLPLLPASLETLTLHHQPQDVVVTYPPPFGEIYLTEQDQHNVLSLVFTLTNLQEKKKKCIPNLRKIAFEGRVSIDHGSIDDCTSVGIILVYT